MSFDLRYSEDFLNEDNECLNNTINLIYKISNDNTIDKDKMTKFINDFLLEDHKQRTKFYHIEQKSHIYKNPITTCERRFNWIYNYFNK